MLEELLKLLIDQLINALASFRVLLDHLHDPLDLGLQRTAIDTAGVEPHHTGSHAINEQARRVIESAKKIWFCQRHPQDRHLQTSKPHPDTRWNPVLLQNGLKHQCHDLDRGLFSLGFCLGLERCGLLAQLARDTGHPGRTVIFDHAAATRKTSRRPGLQGDGCGQRRRGRLEVRALKAAPPPNPSTSA